jgi:hypothetical protein
MQIFQATQEPMVRWQDVPGVNLLVEQLLLDPTDADLAELYQLTMQQQISQAAMSGDAFHGNYPPTVAIPRFGRGRIPLAAFPNQEVLSIPIGDACRNICIVGPTGGGKSNFLRVLIAAILESDL